MGVASRECRQTRPRGRPPHGYLVRIAGREVEVLSQWDAAEQLGVSRQSVSRALRFGVPVGRGFVCRKIVLHKSD